MNLKTGLLSAAAAAALAGSCLAQTSVTLYLVKTENFDLLSRAETSPGVPNPDNTYWIGHNPSAIAYGRGNLFIAGYTNGTAFPLDGADADGDLNTTELTPFNISIVRVNSILKTRTFSPIPGSRYTVGATVNGLGFTGLDYAPNEGTTVRGLVAAWDPNGGGPNLVSRYNVDSGGSPIVAPVPTLNTGFRLGSSGPAWDFGPTGLGVDYAPNGAPDGTPDGPAVATISFGAFGPFGLDPATLNANFGSTLYEVGINNGPRFAPDTEGQLLWRDMSIDRRNGNIAARADNTLLFVVRNPDGTATRADLSPTDPTTDRFVTTQGSFINNQRVSIMAGFDPAGVGDLLVWNDRPTNAVGQAFSTVVRFNKTNRANPADTGAVVTATYLNPDGSPASLGSGNGIYDFFWDSATQLLLVCDTTNRNVYFLSAEQPRACCLSTGECFLLNPTACAATEVAGTAGAAGSTCAPNPCAQPTLACCFGDGTCQNLDAAACTTAGGTAQAAGTTCSPNPCPVATGACCDGTTCTITTPAACTGTFRGSGVACGDPGNPIACCKANFNQIGGVTVQDIFDFLAAYFSNSPSADINGVGGVTLQDLYDYLALYFAGCAG